MPAFAFGRSHAVVMGLVVLAAAAPAAHGQQAYPRWQVEASLDQTGSSSVSGYIAEGPDGGERFLETESVRYTVGASRLARVAPRTSLRLGLSLSNKGFAERTTTAAGTTERQVDLLYLGAPLTLGYNLVNASRGLKPIVEVGVVPEMLLREDETKFEYDLRDGGISYLVSAGIKYNLESGRALVLAPELRVAARDYSRRAPGNYNYRPGTLGLKLAFQF